MRIRSAKASEAKELTAIAFAAKQHWGYSAEAMKSWESMLTVSRIAIEMNPGKVVLFGIRPQHRAQTHATLPLLFNALYWSAEGDLTSTIQQ